MIFKKVVIFKMISHEMMNLIITTILKNHGTTEIIITKTKNGMTHQESVIINNIPDNNTTIGTTIMIVLRMIIIKMGIILKTNKIIRTLISIIKDQNNRGNPIKKNKKLLITYRIR